MPARGQDLVGVGLHKEEGVKFPIKTLLFRATCQDRQTLFFPLPSRFLNRFPSPPLFLFRLGENEIYAVFLPSLLPPSLPSSVRSRRNSMRHFIATAAPPTPSLLFLFKSFSFPQSFILTAPPFISTDFTHSEFPPPLRFQQFLFPKCRRRKVPNSARSSWLSDLNSANLSRAKRSRFSFFGKLNAAPFLS